MIDSFSKSELIARASLLIKYGFRTTIIALDTGLPSHVIRRLYKEVTGTSPGPGQLPESDAIVKSRRSMVEGTLLMALYVNIGGNNIYKQLNINALMKAYDAYLLAREEAELPTEIPWKRLSINEGWVLARDLRSKLASLHRCRCGSLYLTVSQQRIQLKCPVCEIMTEYSTRTLSRK
ncbi:MAG: FlhC family transcriptional regulator [Shewanella sp.]|uniref:FlhC family transcriptional regulator n=1 Tax=Shewanella sp. TaxID=50422 RepID=UPI003F352BE2